MLTDVDFMRRCLQLAGRGAGTVTPNPMVGALLVHEGRIIGEGTRGPITEKLQSAFFDIVYGRNAKYHSWLTPVK